MVRPPSDPLYSYGFQWISAESYGILWKLLESYGMLRNPMESYGIIWNPMESYWIIWIPMESYGFFCLPMNSYGLLCFLIIPMGSYRVPMHHSYGWFLWTPLGFPYIPIEILWTSMHSYGFLRIPMYSYLFLCIPMDSYSIPMYSCWFLWMPRFWGLDAGWTAGSDPWIPVASHMDSSHMDLSHDVQAWYPLSQISSLGHSRLSVEVHRKI